MHFSLVLSDRLSVPGAIPLLITVFDSDYSPSLFSTAQENNDLGMIPAHPSTRPIHIP
jgi:hypothetical protein